MFFATHGECIMCSLIASVFSVSSPVVAGLFSFGLRSGLTSGSPGGRHIAVVAGAA